MKVTAHAMQFLFQALAGEYRAPFNVECKRPQGRVPN